MRAGKSFFAGILAGCALLEAVPAALAADRPVRAAFNEACEELALQAIDEAQDEIIVAIYTMTRMRIADALVKAAGRGVRVRVKYDDPQREAVPQMARALGILRRNGVDLLPISTPEQASMHNKFIVVDHRTVLTGSFNFTVSAALYNWENMVRIDDRGVAAEYRRAWDSIRSGGRPIRAQPSPAPGRG